MKRVAVIGAGASGLAAMKCCLDEGVVPVCFEVGADIGGLWNRSEPTLGPEGGGGVYENCVINNSKEMVAFSDFPVPEHFPTFLSHSYVLEYFRLYADRFRLLDHVRFRCRVTQVLPSETYDRTGQWSVTYSQLDAGQSSTETFDSVMICSGHHRVPYFAKFPGVDTFRGIKLHSCSYSNSFDFIGKRVLIIGIGNSAVDIAVDLSRAASEVFVSTRRGTWVVSRSTVWGYPMDAIANTRLAFCLPQSVLQWAVETVTNLRLDHAAYGLKPSHRVLETHPTISDDLPQQIATGKVHIKHDVTGFTVDDVIFTDGTRERVDAVIFATGYDYRIDFVDEAIVKIEDNDSSLYKFVFPPLLRHPTLGIVGLIQVIGSVIPISEMQSRWFVKVLKGEITLPSKYLMLKEIKERKESLKKKYVDSRRHRMQAFWINYMDSVAMEIGVKPDLWKMALTDPMTAFRCLVYPCVAAQYRLVGPGRWSGATAVIANSLRNNMAGLNTRPEQRRQKPSGSCCHGPEFFLRVILFGLFYLLLLRYWSARYSVVP